MAVLAELMKATIWPYLIAQLPTAYSLSLTRLNTQNLQDLPVPSGQDVQKPRLYFLFMVDDNLPNLQIWQNFFRIAVHHTDYEALLHCENRTRCLQNHPNLQHNFTLIETVQSKWCADLVTPMNALLAAAIRGNANRGNVQDKFIFVSGNSVPVKSFAYVQKKLLIDDGPTSNFCVNHWPDWAWYKGKYVLAKHSQWMILSRAHAEKSLVVQKEVSPEHLQRQMTNLRFGGMEWLSPFLWSLRERVSEITHSPVLDSLMSLVVPPLSGCNDEFWHLAAVVGALDRKQAATEEISLPSLTNGNLTMKDEVSNQFQGVCDTYFVIDGKDKSDFAKKLTATEKFGGTGAFLRPHIHAGTFFTLSEQSLSALRDSPYLFARKIDNTTTYVGPLSLPEAFDALIFSQK